VHREAVPYANWQRRLYNRRKRGLTDTDAILGKKKGEAQGRRDDPNQERGRYSKGEVARKSVVERGDPEKERKRRLYLEY